MHAQRAHRKPATDQGDPHDEIVGLLEDESGKPIMIDGLWALGVGGGMSSGGADAFGAPEAELYFYRWTKQ